MTKHPSYLYQVRNQHVSWLVNEKVFREPPSYVETFDQNKSCQLQSILFDVGCFHAMQKFFHIQLVGEVCDIIIQIFSSNVLIFQKDFPEAYFLFH